MLLSNPGDSLVMLVPCQLCCNSTKLILFTSAYGTNVTLGSWVIQWPVFFPKHAAMSPVAIPYGTPNITKWCGRNPRNIAGDTCNNYYYGGEKKRRRGFLEAGVACDLLIGQIGC